MIFLRHRKIVFFLFLAGLIGFFLSIPGMKINYDMKHFLPDKNLENEFYRQYCEKFNITENQVLVGITNEQNILTHSFLKRLKSFHDSVSRLPAVISVNSIINLKELVSTPLGYLPIPYVHLSEPCRLKEDSLRITHSHYILGRFISRDFRAVSIIVNIQENTCAANKEYLVDQVEKLLTDLHFNDIHFAGNLVPEIEYSRRLKFEMGRSVFVCVLVMIIVSIIVLRKWSVILLMLLIITGGLIYLYGYLSITRGELNLLGLLFPTLVLIVGMSDFIHIYTSYNDKTTRKIPATDAIKKTLKEIGLATFLTSITTAIGFVSLLTSSIKPIRSFGIDAATGIMMTFLIAFIF